ncbi:DUF2057 domain-containing protein [Photobacterium sp. J15]|uniref:DUF2057 domain-containing protein n=1 Tax=Photobacterium sp. J15 TaxID=265901 RepID=UPI0007E2F2BA|nr:DUF2057 domain-containing protein [Photobacterium sp. J15]
MNKKHILACIMLGMLSLPAVADVNLELPKEVSILSINGQTGKSGLLSFVNSSSDEITLPDGNNQIIYEISKIYNKGSSQGVKYRSAPLILSFNSNDENLVMTIPPLKSYKSAIDFDKNISISLANSSGKDIYFINEKLPLDGLSFSRYYSKLLTNYNQSKNNQFATQTVNETSASIQQPQASNNSDQSTSSKMILLKDIFSEMNEEEKQEFLSWAIKNIN